MKIAFLILAYKLPDQLRLLVDELEHKDHHFFIHIDMNSDISPFIKAFEFSKAKIFWIKREYSYWGSYQCVKSLLNGIKQSYYSNSYYEYFIHLSGQDFPLKKANFINDVLKKETPKNFININSVDRFNIQSKGMKRLSVFKFFINDKRYSASINSSHILLRFWARVWLFFINILDFNKEYFEGEFYFMLHRSGVKELLHQMEINTIQSLRLRFSDLPEELFIHTLLGASPNKDNLFIIKDLHRYIDWSNGGRSPRLLNVNDYNVLRNSKYLFGRKFDFSKLK